MTNRAPSCLAALPHPSKRRGLTLIELMLSLSITVMVAGAMSGMMSAVTAGVMDRQDTRTNMVRSHAAESKLSAYVDPSRAVWEVTSTSVALWFNDDSESDSIHVTEVRWIFYNADKKTIEVHFLKFPDEWSQTAKDLADTQYPKAASASSVYEKYVGLGHMAKLRILDGVESFALSTDDPDALDAKRVTFTLTLSASDEPFVITVPTALAYHNPPVY